ncbi:MAG TPA: serine/threonine-protein kinase [Candidatus Obscuribacterales bacterium]
MQQLPHELVIEYKSLPAQCGLFFMLLVSPAWVPGAGVGIIVAFIGFLSGGFSVHALASALGLTCLFLLCLALTMMCSDTKLIVTKVGIQFPLRMLPFVSFRRSRRWADLKSAELADFDSNQKKASGTLTLRFYSGGGVTLKLKRIAKADLEKILLAIDLWAPQCVRNDHLLETHRLLTSDDGKSGPSFTQLWEEELRRRFFPTSFVPLEAGAQLKGGKLVVVRQLAFGGLSALYLAQLQGRQLVVLKEAVVPPTVSEEAKTKALEMFSREARLLSGLNHPSICKVLDVFVENERHYIILEHILGQDLRQYVIEKGRVPEKTIVAWATQICDILEYLHGQSPPIIHRDLTPENLVLDQANKIVLIDFGAANEFIGTATRTVVGKQSYISPEQFRGKPCPQTDLYALGATMYFLATGEEPEALTVLQLPPSIDCSPHFRSIVTKCTEHDLQQRFADVRRLREALNAPVEVGLREK